MNICIALNCFIFMLFYEDQSEYYEYILTGINSFFVLLFSIELICKIIVYKKKFFDNCYNIFETLIVFFSIIATLWWMIDFDTWKNNLKFSLELV